MASSTGGISGGSVSSQSAIKLWEFGALGLESENPARLTSTHASATNGHSQPRHKVTHVINPQHALRPLPADLHSPAAVRRWHRVALELGERCGRWWRWRSQRWAQPVSHTELLTHCATEHSKTRSHWISTPIRLWCDASGVMVQQSSTLEF